MHETVPSGRIPTEAIMRDNYNFNVAAMDTANDIMEENYDQQEANFDLDEAGVDPEILVDGHNIIVLNQDESMADEVIIVAPPQKVASIFGNLGTRCDPEEVIAAGCATFAVPQGWIRLEWSDLITLSY